MQLTPEIRAFLTQHAASDTTRLLLSAARYPGIDMRWAVEQIEARRQLRNKLPEWFANDNLVMGGRIPAEQCSSEQTARYKRQLVVGETLADLTGGMGVDCYYMSRGLRRAIYTERQAHLCEAARNNFVALGADNIEVREGDAFTLAIPTVDTLYLDPARRAHDGSRVYDLADCEPNVIGHHDELLRHCKRLIIKISPMADVARVLQQLAGVSEIHVVAVRNECKELLVVIDAALANENPTPTIHCIDFRAADELRFDFTLSDEQAAPISLFSADDVAAASYLYEPDVTLLKAGAFRLPCARLGVWKADVNSHLYLSGTLANNFPGRTFKIEETMTFSSKTLKTLAKAIPQANIATRNFPLSADELRRRSGIRDGGETYLFGTTLAGLGAWLMRCRKVLILLLLCAVLPTLAIARTKKKKNATRPSVESILQGVQMGAPCQWLSGSEFLYLDSALNAALQPQVTDAQYDTVCFSNTRWTFDGILSEEDWMGQQRMMLIFRSPQGRQYRFATGRLMQQMTDTTYRPALPSLCALQPIRECDRRLRGQEFYLLINDERLLTADSTLRLEKFVKVRIDSVTVGTELAPLHVWFTHPQGGGIAASVMTSLPDSRENATSAAIQKYFSANDPYLRYPNITAEVWAMIRANQVRIDMTQEEVRLALGRPQRYEHFNTKGGMIERWHYADRRLLEFIDGRLRRVAIER